MCFPIQRWFTLGTVRDTFDIHAPCRRANIRSQGQKRNRRNIRRATDDAVDTAKDVVGSAWDEVGDVLSRSMYLPGLKPKENRADRPPSFSARMAKTRPNQSEPLSGCTLSSRTPICSRCVFVDAGRSSSAMPRGRKRCGTCSHSRSQVQPALRPDQLFRGSRRRSERWALHVPWWSMGEITKVVFAFGILAPHQLP